MTHEKAEIDHTRAAGVCRHCGAVIKSYRGIGGVQWRDLSQRSPMTCFKARNLIHEPEAPSGQGAGEQEPEGTRDEAGNETSGLPQAIHADTLTDSRPQTPVVRRTGLRSKPAPTKPDTIHWPKIASPGIRCSCGWTIGGVVFDEAKRRWWRHLGDSSDVVLRPGFDSPKEGS